MRRSVISAIVSVLIGSVATSAHAEGPFTITPIDGDPLSALLNDQGTVLTLDYEDPTASSRAVGAKLRLADGQTVTLGTTKLDSTSIFGFNNNGAVAGIEYETGSVVVLQNGKSDITVHRRSGDASVDTISLGDNGTLAIIEARGTDDTLAYYALTYANATTQPVLTGEVRLPNAAYEHKILVLSDGRILVYSNDFEDGTLPYYLLSGSSLTPIAESLLPKDAILQSAPLGKVVFGRKASDSGSVQGLLYSSDLVNPPVAQNSGFDEGVARKFFGSAASLDGAIAGALSGYSFGLYEGSDALTVLLPGGPAIPLECFYPASQGIRFYSFFNQPLSAQFNSSGQLLARGLAQSSSALLTYFLLTPASQPTFTNYCPQLTVKLDSKCKKSAQGATSTSCKATATLKDDSGAAIAGETVTVYQWGKLRRGGDGAEYAGPRRRIASATTKPSGKAALTFRPKQGKRLYEIVSGSNTSTFRMRGKTFEIVR